MMRYRYNWLLLLMLSFGIVEGCSKDDLVSSATSVSDAFESGSIGEVTKVSDTKWTLYIADDNDNAGLPAAWRSWWYVKMEHLVQDAPTEITIKNSGWPYYYVPIYSYDQLTWSHFTEEEVTQAGNGDLTMSKRFDHKTVWIARFYPYTFSDLKRYLNRIDRNPYVSIQIPGYSQEGRPLYVVKITDPAVPVSGKKRVFMHARTHSAETPPSFVIEGLIRFLLSGSLEANQMLAGFEFYIFPMQNVDGVIAGNYRSTPKSENLEVMWYYDAENPLNLTSAAPPEVTVLEQYAKDLMTDGGPPITIALNLHASNSEPDTRPFFYPHFGAQAQGYTSVQTSLWAKQHLFISAFVTHYGQDMIEPLPEDGGSGFATNTYPESWWWVNYQDQVMAMTLEMTYGRAGFSPRWVEPDDWRSLGTSLALGIRDYYDESFARAPSVLKSARESVPINLKYPALYPPLLEAASKE